MRRTVPAQWQPTGVWRMIPYDFSLLIQPTDPATGIPQNTQKWLDARRGRITASLRAYKLLYSRDSTLATMMDEMAQELTTPAGEGFSNKYTEHGHAFEDQAIGEYDMARLSFGAINRTPGMFVHPEFDIASATPDFFEGDDTTGQIKCPYILKNHLELVHWGISPRKGTPGHAKYYSQVQFESFVTQRPRIIFVSYHPDAPATNQLYVEEVEQNPAVQAKFAERLAWVNHHLVNNTRPEVTKIMPGVDGIPDLF